MKHPFHAVGRSIFIGILAFANFFIAVQPSLAADGVVNQVQGVIAPQLVPGTNANPDYFWYCTYLSPTCTDMTEAAKNSKLDDVQIWSANGDRKSTRLNSSH